MCRLDLVSHENEFEPDPFCLLIELLLLVDATRSIRFAIVVNVPFKLPIYLMVIYGGCGVAIKTWWRDERRFEAFRKRDFDLLISEDARLNSRFRRFVLVLFCMTETFLLVATGYLVCSLAILGVHFDSL